MQLLDFRDDAKRCGIFARTIDRFDAGSVRLIFTPGHTHEHHRYCSASRTAVPFHETGGTGAAYRSSKTALNALTVDYAQALASEDFKVNALAPGLRATRLNARAASGGDPAEAAAGAVRLALLPDDGATGGFFSWDGSTAPW